MRRILLSVAIAVSGCEFEPVDTNAAPSYQRRPPCTPEAVTGPFDNNWRAIGPHGGSVHAIAFSPANENVVLIATYGAGVFRSEDGGETWGAANVGLTNNRVISLVADPLNDDTFYCGTEGLLASEVHVFWTEDNGANWTRITPDGLPWLFNGVTGLAATEDDLYVGSQAVYRFAEGAWEEISPGFFGSGFVRLASDPEVAGHLYAGTYQGGVFRTEDGGRTWDALGTDTFATYMHLTVAVDPRNRNRVAAGAGDLWVSNDYGNEWARVLPDIFDGIHSIHFDAAVPDRMWVGHELGLAVISTDGNTVSPIEAFDHVPVLSVAVSPYDENTVLVGTHMHGLYRSVDGGSSFTDVSNGISNTFISALAVAGDNPNRILAGTFGNGLFVTQNGGGDWQTFDALREESIQAIAVDHLRGWFFVGTWNGLFVSDNEGDTWMEVGAPLQGCRVVAMTTTDSAVWVGTFGDGLFRSESGTNEWSAVEFPERYITAIVPITESQEILVGSLSGVYRTSDGGQAWTGVSAGLRDANVRSMARDPLTSTVHIATGDAIYSSEDNGDTWSRQSDSLRLQYFRAVLSGPPLTAASWGGVFVSEGDGVRWTALGRDLVNQQVTSLVWDNDVLLAGTYGGGVFLFDACCRPLYGSIVDTSERPVGNVRVVLEPGARETMSGPNGEYSFSHLPPAIYQIRLEWQGETRGQSTADLLTFDAAEVNIALERVEVNGNVPMMIVGGPSNGVPLLLGQTLSLTAILPSSSTEYLSAHVAWESDLDGPLGTTDFDSSLRSVLDVALRHSGPHLVSAHLWMGDAHLASRQTSIDVKTPGALHPVGMAWDGAHLWVAHEPSDTAEMGRVYELVRDSNGLSVISSFAHPSPTPGGLAWDGGRLWSTGVEGPDPFHAWENGTGYLYLHDGMTDEVVSRRWGPGSGLETLFQGLTWDGDRLWASVDAQIMSLVTDTTLLSTGPAYSALGNQTRTIEWIGEFLWAHDSETSLVYKLDPASDFALVCSFEPGIVGGYGMAWDGTQLWMDDVRFPHLVSVTLPTACPAD